MKNTEITNADLFKYDQWVSLALTIVAALWFTSPMWTSSELVFAGRLATDNVVTPWFYDFVARSLQSGLDYEALRGFDYPSPHPREVEFPALADAVLAAPLAWVFDWPQQWGVALSTAVLINAISLNLFARVIGAGAIGSLVAGISGVLLRPVWVDLVMGRMNVATPGIAVMAMVFALWAFPVNARSFEKYSHLQRGVSALAAAILGVIAAQTYPPFLALLIAVGVPPALMSIWRGGLLGLLLPVCAAGLALWWSYDLLEAMWFAQYRAQDCSQLSCPDRYNAVAWQDLFRTTAEPTQGLSYSGIQAVFWWILPICLIHRHNRVVGGLLCIVAIAYGMLSLGPCPRLTPLEDLTGSWVPILKQLAEPIWCQAAHLHDYGRFATVGAIVLAVLAGLSVDGIVRSKWPFKRVIGIGLGAWVIWSAGEPLWGEYMDPKKWHTVPNSAIVAFLDDKAPSNIVEFPYDRSGQFLSALSAPTHNRMNPLRPTDPPRSNLVFYLWAYQVGRGRKPDVVPDSTDVQKANMQYIFYEPSRCLQGAVNKAGCDSWVVEHITETFGKPKTLAFDTLVW